MSTSITLKRSINLPTLSFYGIGTIIGAGIYVLIGKVAVHAGVHLPIAFLLAGCIAAFTALSYAELAARFPQSAGSALYVFEAWRRPWLAQVIGGLVALTGIVSAATITNGFVGYLQIFVDLPDQLAMVLLIVLLTGIAAWGIKESAAMITAITLIEVAGLLYVIYASQFAPTVNSWTTIFKVSDVTAWSGILVGSFLAFYAFIGFEDMVNVVEEVKQPRRNLPLGIMIAIVVSTLLYAVIALIAVRIMPASDLSASKAPLADLVVNGGRSPAFIGIISLFAVVNGALVQIIMASRLLLGMANKNIAPAIFKYIHPKTQTPIVTTVVVSLCILVFALWLPLIALAKLTSFVMLLIFAMVNLSLILIRLRDKTTEGATTIRYPFFVPIIGCLLCVSLILLQLLQ